MPDFRVIPSIEHLRQRPSLDALAASHGRDAVVDALREETSALRARVAAGESAPATTEDATALIEQGAAARLAAAGAASLRRVLNATGVIVHTNLGRAPLAAVALERIVRLGAGYTNLEYDLAHGRRGARDTHAEALLCRLTGAEAAVVVNNCAAATLLVLAALARGREVLVSRGELVEIGGGFRVPDVMTQSGARLREVGTTNRTRVADYALAIGGETGAILRVHPSNFRIEGFTERASLAELVELGRRFGVPVIEDLGGGLVTEHGAAAEPLPGALSGEPTVQATVGSGADVVCFSGDKLLGGPQAGIIAGGRKLVAALKSEPLFRALRCDKLILSALEATVDAYLYDDARVPVVEMLRVTTADLRARAERIVAGLDGLPLTVRVGAGRAHVGGGTLPRSVVPSVTIDLLHRTLKPQEMARRLRAQEIPVIGYVARDTLKLDLRTIFPRQDAEVIGAIRAASTS
jgi:L-seryl-tRNA(Ser) seleniumtransferase